MATTLLPAPLDIPANQPFTKAAIDAAFTYIVQQLLILQSFQPSWQAAVDQLNQVGLSRINEALTPTFAAYSQIASLGAIFQATSSTPLTIAIAQQTFVVDVGLQNQFAPARWMSALSSNGEASMAGLIISYDRASGELVMAVEETYGSGTFSSWQISPTSPPLLAAAVVDGGVFDANSIESEQIPFLYAGTQSTSAVTDGGSF